MRTHNTHALATIPRGFWSRSFYGPPVALPGAKPIALLRRFESDQDEIWQDCSSSNSHRITSRIFEVTSYFQDGGHDVHLPARFRCSSVRRMPASPWSACDVISWLYATMRCSSWSIIFILVCFYRAMHCLSVRPSVRLWRWWIRIT